MSLPSDHAIDATLTTSRAFLAVIARSVTNALTAVTLPELRLLVSLTNQGPQTVAELSNRQRMSRSLVESNVDSLAIPGFVTVDADLEEPTARVQIAPSGRAIVDEVTAIRRAELGTILARLTTQQQDLLGAAFSLFADAAEEGPVEDALILGL